MLVSTKGRYALRVMIELAEHPTDGYIPLKLIAERQGISEKYLESIIKLLVRARLLTGLRGKGGGYRLTRSAAACGGPRSRWRWARFWSRSPWPARTHSNAAR